MHVSHWSVTFIKHKACAPLSQFGPYVQLLTVHCSVSLSRKCQGVRERDKTFIDANGGPHSHSFAYSWKKSNQIRREEEGEEEKPQLTLTAVFLYLKRGSRVPKLCI